MLSWAAVEPNAHGYGFTTAVGVADRETRGLGPRPPLHKNVLQVDSVIGTSINNHIATAIEAGLIRAQLPSGGAAKILRIDQQADGVAGT